MDPSSEVLREQRRKRILENGRARMERILGTVGENQRREPMVDGLGRSGVTDDIASRRGLRDDGERVPQVDSANVDEEDSEAIEKSGSVTSRSSTHHRHSRDSSDSVSRTSVQSTVSGEGMSWTMRILRQRPLVALSMGAILRLALWLALLPIDSSLFPYILAFEIGFEIMPRFSPAQDAAFASRSRDRLGFGGRIRATCWRLLDDLIMILSGFVAVHFVFSILGIDVHM